MHIIGLAGWSGSGKTTLLVKLISYITELGYTVSTIKHAHHGFEIDKPGKDSYRHRSSGAKEVLVASSNRWALMHELADESEPSLKLLLEHMSDVDLVIVEGYKNQVLNKIEINRSTINKPLIAGTDNSVIAIASDKSTKNIENLGLPVLNLDDTREIAHFILSFFSLTNHLTEEKV
tara:strand:+ start:3491 stop:4021 length:531 start_codon:yes stop_codon:yes gene_type:complete